MLSNSCFLLTEIPFSDYPKHRDYFYFSSDTDGRADVSQEVLVRQYFVHHYNILDEPQERKS